MATSSNDRFAISAEKYLAKHCIQTYFEDAIAQLLEHKETNPKVNVSKFFSEYFVSVREGSHTLHREYAYVRATFHNRASFVHSIWKCFRYIGKKGDLLSIKEYHSLVGLLCYDFPLALLQKTAGIVLLEDATDSPISFADFLYAFQTQFLFDEFIDQCWKSYTDLSRVGASPRDPVVVPSGEASALKGHHRSQPSAAGVDTSQLYRQLAPLAERSQHSVPPVSVLKEILHSTDRVTYYGFLLALAKSEALNTFIGKLPRRDEVYSGVELLPAPQAEAAVADKATVGDVAQSLLHTSVRHTSAKLPDSRPASAKSRSTAHSQGIRSTKERRGGAVGAAGAAGKRPAPRQATLLRADTSSDDDDTDSDSDDTETDN